jgi:hypothetical protein
MSIKQLDNQQARETSLVPSHPFVMPIIGAIGCGKTTTLVNLLTNEQFYKKKFHRIIFISVTAELDDKTRKILDCVDICISNQNLQDQYDKICKELDDNHERTILPKFHAIDDENVHEKYYPEILDNLYKHQKSIIKEFGKNLSDRVLVVIDDAITAGCYVKSHQDVFAKFATSLRHVNCSVIHCSQLWKAVPKIIRTQSTCGVFQGVPNELEIKDIYENFSCGYPFYKWNEIFQVIVSKPFQPFVSNLKNKPGTKLQRGFESYVG